MFAHSLALRIDVFRLKESYDWLWNSTLPVFYNYTYIIVTLSLWRVPSHAKKTGSEKEDHEAHSKQNTAQALGPYCRPMNRLEGKESANISTTTQTAHWANLR